MEKSHAKNIGTQLYTFNKIVIQSFYVQNSNTGLCWCCMLWS